MSHSPYWFHAAQARRILAALDGGATEIVVSLDLNRSQRRCALGDDALLLDAATRLARDELARIAATEERIFYLAGDELEILEVRGDGYHKLVPTEQAPLLEISGVKMHIAKGTDPFTSAGQMAAQVVKQGDRVLDTCSGLGYAAIAARRLGAKSVVTVEYSSVVLALRQRNPWSRELDDPAIVQVHDDSNAYIRTLAEGSWDAVIHDPPRFSLAGELYGEAFYRELHRVLSRRGRLFHYTGNPHLIKHGGSFMDQAARRLKSAGFAQVRKVPELMGLLAAK